MEVAKLNSILDRHAAWKRGEERGQFAKLALADLGGGDLSDADLSGADLRGADLGCASLRCADLSDADLSGANLRGSDLWCASLRSANLSDANLRCANLRRANLRCANLSGANLLGANLGGADLGGANLGGADLSNARLSGITVPWMSHDLVAEILRRAAGEDIEKRQLAGLVLISHDWCWGRFLKIEHPLRQWALDELRKWIRDGDEAPAILRDGPGDEREEARQ